MMTPFERQFIRKLLLTLSLVFLFAFILVSCSPTIRYVCPPLSPAPKIVVDAMEVTGRKDPSAAAWVIDLDRHYQKCDIVNAKK